MFLNMYKRAFDVLKKRPIRLWGLSLLAIVIEIVAVVFSLGFLPIGIAFCFVVGCGMEKIYLDSLEGTSVNTDQLFDGFKTGKSFFRIAGGMAWKKLWALIWSLVSVAACMLCIVPTVFSGISLFSKSYYGYGYSYGYGSAAKAGGLLVLGVLLFVLGLIPAIVKSYEYRFVPYILMTRPDVNATAALRLSKEQTKGKKLQMFLADIILGGGYFIAVLILSLFAQIPFIGVLFGIVELVLQIVYMLFAPIFTGLYGAAFYLAPAPVKPEATYNTDNTTPNNNTDTL